MRDDVAFTKNICTEISDGMAHAEPGSKMQATMFQHSSDIDKLRNSIKSFSTVINNVESSRQNTIHDQLSISADHVSMRSDYNVMKTMMLTMQATMKTVQAEVAQLRVDKLTTDIELKKSRTDLSEASELIISMRNNVQTAVAEITTLRNSTQATLTASRIEFNVVNEKLSKQDLLVSEMRTTLTTLCRDNNAMKLDLTMACSKINILEVNRTEILAQCGTLHGKMVNALQHIDIIENHTSIIAKEHIALKEGLLQLGSAVKEQQQFNIESRADLQRSQANLVCKLIT